MSTSGTRIELTLLLGQTAAGRGRGGRLQESQPDGGSRFTSHPTYDLPDAMSNNRPSRHLTYKSVLHIVVIVCFRRERGFRELWLRIFPRIGEKPSEGV